jgi:hypothetical protein
MRKHQTKRVNQTFSIPLEISNDLHVYVKQREMSQFVSDAIRKELEAKKNQLRKEYATIKKDKGQLEAMKDWESTVGDGLDDW